ncbi:5-oxoprolinase subunit PxpB [Aminithiophilus ramosus]|uniref:5-oxoprolinase subunit PxpB n=2 Tax=Synergistales TaxID=649776 RepID=A0A9Q7AFU5_9BACT|nr:5-oxoprolinase subunit PxpB [Aminithiophilus ramosus]QTX31355.1 5-oxoprolinase subunit PxpB [Aminithiophilus ramosus]QVL35154.1 5-oxoprolinase subunit PxpB [Synergistota bacterium]
MTREKAPRLLQAGDGCLVVEFGDAIDLAVNGRVQQLRRAIEKRPFVGLLETVPTYRSLALYFDPTRTETEGLFSRIEEMALSVEDGPDDAGQVMTVPVLYGGDEGPDLENVARHNGLSPEEVIARHSGRDYYCYMLGFTPGFSYLGGMDESIATPRLATPRTLIPAGSVGIAGRQTGIYPIDSPGGWQLIGRTPLRLFDPSGETPILIEAGIWVRFRSVDRREFLSLSADVAARRYRPQVGPRKGEGR